MKINFAIPAYNEEMLIRKNLLILFNFLNKQNYNFDWKISLIINGSNDDSEKIAKNLKKNYEQINFFIIKEKGKGNAIKKFFDQEMSSSHLIFMDIDLAVSLENINDLINSFLEKNDLIIGSRLLKKSKTNRSLIRSFSSKAYIFISKIIIKHNFSDLQCGFKGIKKEAWKKISPYIEDKNWFFDTELLIYSEKLKIKTREIPVNWSENRYEKRKSKIKLIKNSIIFIKSLIKLRKKLINNNYLLF